jgi:hypothetical protein
VRYAGVAVVVLIIITSNITVTITSDDNSIVRYLERHQTSESVRDRGPLET